MGNFNHCSRKQFLVIVFTNTDKESILISLFFIGLKISHELHKIIAEQKIYVICGKIIKVEFSFKKDINIYLFK